jgi:hypothetical protein
MSDVSEGWALELRGEKFDLDDLREGLRPPFDPWVEEYELDGAAMLLLRSKNWSGLYSTADMMADARRLIDQINAVHLVGQPDARPIEYGVTLRFGQNGKPLPIMLAATGNFTLQGGRSRTTIAGRKDPSAEAGPVPSPMQQRIARASSDDDTADLLGFVARANNWFDLYKAMECLERVAGGGHVLKALETDWATVRQTANCHRHAPNEAKFPFPLNPPDLDQARAVVLRAVDKLL